MAIDRNKVQQQAEKLVQAKKYDAGIAQYQALVSDNPRDLVTLNKIGDLYVQLGKKGEATRTFTRIAEIHAADGFFLKAIAIYKKINKIEPSHLDTLQRLADLYAKQGLKPEARAQYVAVADAHMKAGQAPKAISIYESLVKLEPDNLKHRLALAELKLKYGKGGDAARAFLDLARELDAKGMTKESARVYEMALNAGRGDLEVAEGLGAALVASGQFEKALSVADQLLKEHPQSLAVHAIRGEALAGVGRGDEAMDVLRRVLAKDAHRADAPLALAKLLAAKGEIDEAHALITPAVDTILGAGRGPELVKVLESLLASAPESRPVLQSLYETNNRLGNKAGTIVFGEKLAEAAAQEGDVDAALAVAKRLAEIEPQVTTHRERVTRLKATSGSTSGSMPAVRPATDRQRAAASVTPPAPPAPEAPADDAGDFEIEIDVSGGSESNEAQDIGGGSDEAVGDLAEGPAGEEALSPEDEEFISEHLTEAEVFVKYGLADRAAEQLRAIVERFPWHVPSRQRLRDVYLEEGNRERAAGEAAALAKILADRGDRTGAAAALQEAKSIDASCAAVTAMEALLQGGGEAATRPGPTRRAPAKPPDPEPEAGEFVIEEEETIEEPGAEGTAAGSGPPQEDLREFDFYLEQQMMSEAAACLSRLEASFGPHAEIEARRAALGAASVGEESQALEVEEGEESQAAEPAAEQAPEPAGVQAGEAQGGAKPGAAAADFFDLASELDASLFGSETEAEADALAAIEASPEGHSLDEIVSAFKKGIEQQVDSEDFETHYNLGIAYKEMGLTEEAIGEFQFASKDAKRLPDCCSMLGICFKEKGMLPLAVTWYRKGLDALLGAAGADDGRVNGVRYDLAEVLEQMGEYRQAMALLVEVYGADTRYRDVGARIKELEKRLSS
ncbi:MAG: tetratricopeptide repeat protein [Acidobacteria bacterium]|nr:tetratricopeptide repeat protein [Acidobacteriota bacterium]